MGQIYRCEYRFFFSHLLDLVYLVLRMARGTQEGMHEDMLGRCEGILSRSSQRCENPSQSRVTNGANLNLIVSVVQRRLNDVRLVCIRQESILLPVRTGRARGTLD